MDNPVGKRDNSRSLECLGGPHDGEPAPDRGIWWRIMATVDPETGTVRPGSSGTYVQRQGVYRWEPDPE